MEKIIQHVELAQKQFRDLILESNIAEIGLKEDQYTRYLQMQYHLVKDVQRPFYEIAAHEQIFHRKKFREFLLSFGTEEGPHYKMAERDLKNLGQSTGIAPLDVKLWWSYFSSQVKERPFLRLGGTCVLENVGTAVGDLVDQALANSPYLNQKNTTFLILHKHEVLNHGEEIIEALREADLTKEETEEVVCGIHDAKTLFFRVFRWVLNGEDSY